MLLEHGADPKAKGSDGETPLDLAVDKKREKTILLLEKHMASG